MDSLLTFLKRIWSVFRRERFFDELRDEMEFHIKTRAESYIRAGMKPSDAFKTAEAEFGNTLRHREQSWYQWAFTWEDELIHDIRYAVRLLWQNKGWTAIAILSLALGIGANTAIFSVFDALLLKSLPVKNPDELVVLRGQYQYPFFQAIRRGDIFSDVFASSGVDEQDIEIDNALPERASISLVSGNYFSTLGVSPVIGRAFTEVDESGPETQAVAVLSYGFWQRRFGRNPDIIGRSIRIRGESLTVIGVTPPRFLGERVGSAPELWIPLSMWPRVIPGRNLIQSPGTAWLDIIGRRKPAVGAGALEAALTMLFRSVLTDIFKPGSPETSEISRATVRLAPADKGLSRLREQFSRPLEVMFGLVVLMLLIACTNVANLLLARAASRKREIALRLALGIGRRRLIRQLLTENLALAALSALLGVGVAVWGKTALLKLASTNAAAIPLDAAIDQRVLAFVIALTAATAILFGLAPIWQAMRLDITEPLRGARDSSIHRSGHRSGHRSVPGHWLVAGQLALSLTLLMVAGLFLRTLINLRAVDLGYKPDHLSIVDINPGAAGYQATRYAVLAGELLNSLQQIPGVTAATFSENGTLMGRDSGTNQMRPQEFAGGPEGIPHADFDLVGPGYFSTMGMPLIAGRDLLRTDDTSSEQVMVINEALARHFFRDADPVGRRMLWGSGKAQRTLRIVGVIRNVKHRSLRSEDGLRFYIPYLQQPERELASIRFIARSSESSDRVAAQLQQAIRSIDTRIPILSVDSVPALVDRSLVQERMVATLSGLFAANALVLTCVGLYGLMSYRVTRRTNEIGIRMAIGSSAGQVIRVVMQDAFKMVVAGAAAGCIGVLLISRFVATLLFGITPLDLTALLGALGFMLAFAGVAAYLPARRASQVDPLIALRHD